MLTVFLCFYENFSLSRCTASLALALRHNSLLRTENIIHKNMQFHEPHPDVCFIHEKLITTWNYSFLSRISRTLCRFGYVQLLAWLLCILGWLSFEKLFPAARQAPFVSLKINYIFSAPFIMPCKPVRHGDNGAKSSGGLIDGCSSQRRPSKFTE